MDDIVTVAVCFRLRNAGSEYDNCRHSERREIDRKLFRGLEIGSIRDDFPATTQL